MRPVREKREHVPFADPTSAKGVLPVWAKGARNSLMPIAFNQHRGLFRRGLAR